MQQQSGQWLCKKCGSINVGPGCFKCGPAVPVSSKVATAAKRAVIPYRSSAALWWRTMPPVKRLGFFLVAGLVMLFAWNQYLDLRLKMRASGELAEEERLTLEAERQARYEAAYRKALDDEWLKSGLPRDEFERKKMFEQWDRVRVRNAEEMRKFEAKQPKEPPALGEIKYDYYGNEIKGGNRRRAGAVPPAQGSAR